MGTEIGGIERTRLEKAEEGTTRAIDVWSEDQGCRTNTRGGSWKIMVGSIGRVSKGGM